MEQVPRRRTLHVEIVLVLRVRVKILRQVVFVGAGAVRYPQRAVGVRAQERDVRPALVAVRDGGRLEPAQLLGLAGGKVDLEQLRFVCGRDIFPVGHRLFRNGRIRDLVCGGCVLQHVRDLIRRRVRCDGRHLAGVLLRLGVFQEGVAAAGVGHDVAGEVQRIGTQQHRRHIADAFVKIEIDSVDLPAVFGCGLRGRLAAGRSHGVRAAGGCGVAALFAASGKHAQQHYEREQPREYAFFHSIFLRSVCDGSDRSIHLTMKAVKWEAFCAVFRIL